jgi:monofunctional glycosyltransferase
MRKDGAPVDDETAHDGEHPAAAPTEAAVPGAERQSTPPAPPADASVAEPSQPAATSSDPASSDPASEPAEPERALTPPVAPVAAEAASDLPAEPAAAAPHAPSPTLTEHVGAALELSPPVSSPDPLTAVVPAPPVFPAPGEPQNELHAAAADEAPPVEVASETALPQPLTEAPPLPAVGEPENALSAQKAPVGDAPLVEAASETALPASVAPAILHVSVTEASPQEWAWAVTDGDLEPKSEGPPQPLTEVPPLPAAGEPENALSAQEAPVEDAPLVVEAASETALPAPMAPAILHASATEASPPERPESEADGDLEPKMEEPPQPLKETPPPAASVASEPSLPPLVGEAATPASGHLEAGDRVPELMAAEELPSAPQPILAPFELPEAPDRPGRSVAHETQPAEPEPKQDEVSEPARLAPEAPAVVVASAQIAPVRRDESAVPEVQSASAGLPRVEAKAVSLAASVPATAWTQPVQAAPEPAASALRLPAWMSGPAAPGAALRRPPAVRRIFPWLRLAVRGAAIAAAVLVITVLSLVVLYRWVNPPISTLMISRSVAGTEIERTWVPLKRISPHLMRAVILSEDGGFCRHGGVDWSAIEEAIESDRGGSTITMQVVKNLFLWPSRSYVRKAIEMGLAYLVEALWSKRRILEIYLNVAEWGDGVFGAEAAAQSHFGKRAARLTAEEAALLAAVLPNPIERTAGAPSFMTNRLASRLLVRMRTSRADFSCVPVPRLEPRTAPQKSLQQKAPQKIPDKAPLVQGPRMTL